jgi:peroxiredoxin
MNRPMRILGLALTLSLLSIAAVRADDEPKAGKPYLDVTGELNENDEPEPTIAGSRRKVYQIAFEAGKIYRIDMTSETIDTVLRLVDPEGQQLDDDGGFAAGARIVHRAQKTGRYKIVAAAVKTEDLPQTIGKYRLIVRDSSLYDAAIARTRATASGNRGTKQQRAVLVAVVDYFAEQKKLPIEDAGMGTRMFTLIRGLPEAQQLPKRERASFAQKMHELLSRSDDAKILVYATIYGGIARRLDLVGREMELTGTLLDGSPLNWKSYRGKVVLVNFWYSTSAFCQEQMPHLKKLLDKHRRAGFEIVGVSDDAQIDSPADFMKKNGYDWPCIYEKGVERQPMADHYGNLGPQTFLVGRDGRVIVIDPERDELDALIERHVGKKSP